MRHTGRGGEKERGRAPGVGQQWGMGLPLGAADSLPHSCLLPSAQPQPYLPGRGPPRPVARWPSSITQPGVATYLGEFTVGHKSGQGLAHTPLILRAQVLGGHLDAHLERESRWRSEEGRKGGHTPEAPQPQETGSPTPGLGSASISPTRGVKLIFTGATSASQLPSKGQM